MNYNSTEGLKLCGKSYMEYVQEDLLKIINWYATHTMSTRNPFLLKQGYELSDIIDEVLVSLFSKNKDSGMTHLQEQFIICCGEGEDGILHLKNYIKRATINTKLTLITRSNAKPNPLKIEDCFSSKKMKDDVDVFNIIDNDRLAWEVNSSAEERVCIKLALESTLKEPIEFKGYTNIDTNNVLTSSDIIRFLIKGYKFSQIKEKILNAKSNKNVSEPKCRDIIKQTRELAKKNFDGYN